MSESKYQRGKISQLQCESIQVLTGHFTTNEIADILSVTPSTIVYHRQELCGHNTQEATE